MQTVFFKYQLEDKGTRKVKKTNITTEKGCLLEEDIKYVVNDAEKFTEENNKIKEYIDARNGLELFVYNLKNIM